MDASGERTTDVDDHRDFEFFPRCEEDGFGLQHSARREFADRLEVDDRFGFRIVVHAQRECRSVAGQRLERRRLKRCSHRHG